MDKVYVAWLKPVPPAGARSRLLRDHELMPNIVPACQSPASTTSLLRIELCLLLLQPWEPLSEAALVWRWEALSCPSRAQPACSIWCKQRVIHVQPFPSQETFLARGSSQPLRSWFSPAWQEMGHTWPLPPPCALAQTPAMHPMILPQSPAE